MSEEEPQEPQGANPIMGFRLSKVRKVRPRELLIRFGFGALISLTAALIGKAAGAKAGGMFLAFPAILPATLTLLEQKHGTEDAVHDTRGAVLGAIGLVPFAVVAAVCFGRLIAAFVVALASLAWLAASMAAYLIVVAWQRRDRHSISRP